MMEIDELIERWCIKKNINGCISALEDIKRDPDLLSDVADVMRKDLARGKRSLWRKVWKPIHVDFCDIRRTMDYSQYYKIVEEFPSILLTLDSKIDNALEKLKLMGHYEFATKLSNINRKVNNEILREMFESSKASLLEFNGKKEDEITFFSDYINIMKSYETEPYEEIKRVEDLLEQAIDHCFEESKPEKILDSCREILPLYQQIRVNMEKAIDYMEEMHGEISLDIRHTEDKIRHLENIHHMLDEFISEEIIIKKGGRHFLLDLKKEKQKIENEIGLLEHELAILEEKLEYLHTDYERAFWLLDRTNEQSIVGGMLHGKLCASF